MRPEEVQWSRNFFNTLKLNATWAIPRSGNIFKKVSEKELALDDVMPWTEAMAQGYREGRDVPPNAGALRLFQSMDFETIAQRFRAAGIKVTDPKQLLKEKHQ